MSTSGIEQNVSRVDPIMADILTYIQRIRPPTEQPSDPSASTARSGRESRAQ